MHRFSLHDMSRSTKRLIYFAVDTALVPVCLWGALQTRAVMLGPTQALWFFGMLSLLGAGIVWVMRLDWIKLSAVEARAISRISGAAAILTGAAAVLGGVLALDGAGAVALTFGVLFCFSSVAARILGLHLLRRIGVGPVDAQPVAIYGAGTAGVQLAGVLWQGRRARPVVFVDDDPALQGVLVAGLPVHPPQVLPQLIARYGIAQVILAMPSVTKSAQQTLIQRLDLPQVEVRMLPSYPELMSSEGEVDRLQPISAEALLGREKVALSAPEITKTYAGRVIMVTGAGGSIGSELCRQLLHCRPAALVLFEQGEHNLYQIDQGLRADAATLGITIVARLGSVADAARLRQVMRAHGVEIVLHAAAYKHVPMVEENELEGARNNVLGTQVVAEIAAAEQIERFILVSSDKAVRPANVMGATKRMAEMVVQDIQTRSTQTKFAMVRFGNVLGSSGSVLPLFQRQIAEGGPVTVTHADITRYFMTISEAARLVLTAGAYARGGDVFVLDMGKPQKIVDVARRMIALAGRTVQDPASGEGEIAIRFTGLRPGEKLFEELLIDRESLRPTPHPKILRAEETRLSQIEVAAMLRDMRRAIDAADADALRAVIRARVEGYRPPAAGRIRYLNADAR